MSTVGESGSRKLEMRIESDPAHLATTRKALEAFTLKCGLGEKAAQDIGLCLNEALANVMRHAYHGQTDRPIMITAEFDAHSVLTVNVRDWGNRVDPSTLPREPYNPHTPGGVGLICLSELLDEMVYTPQPDGMLAMLVKKKQG
ncbi:MAG: ATP-binding protein [Tepidisphaeraceae bacterium]